MLKPLLNKFNYSFLALQVLLSSGNHALASDVVRFSPNFLSKSVSDSVDWSHFENDEIQPGLYTPEIFANDNKIGVESVRFSIENKKTELYVPVELIGKLRVRNEYFPPDINKHLESSKNGFVSLNSIFPQINFSYDSGAQRLDLSIPQAMIENSYNGYVPPALWDKGETAGLFGYNMNVYSSNFGEKKSNSLYLGLNTGFNWNGWYFRHTGNYNYNNFGGNKYQRINAYIQRDIPSINGKFVSGESNTRGYLFDTIPYRGIEVFDDERMLPRSERGYAPSITGVARTNAKISVKQNGALIYETTVSPGAFDITNINPTGYGGDLEVKVTEADGSVRTFYVPYSSVTQLLRKGYHHYDILVGKYIDSSLKETPPVYQLTYQRGMTDSVTANIGTQVNSDYYSILGGVAINSAIGAFGVDISQARTHLRAGEENLSQTGQSIRLSYNKYIETTKSNIYLATYRYSTSGFMDLRTAMLSQEALARNSDTEVYRARSRFTVTLSQGLIDGWGQLFLTGYIQDYWNKKSSSDVQYQVGYSNAIGNVSFNVNAGRSRSSGGNMEDTLGITLSMPLGTSYDANAPRLSTSYQKFGQSEGETVNISSLGGDDNQYSYGINGSHYNEDAGENLDLYGQYRTQFTDTTATYSTGKNYNSVSVGASGSIIGYQNGIVFSPYVSDNFAIIEAEGASGAKVGGYSGVKVDPWGHAAVPYLTPYELNDITINPKGLPDSVEMDTTNQKVAPYDGAVVRLRYRARPGQAILVNVTTSNGENLPFGAEITDSSGEPVGYVGQNGQLYARVQKSKDSLRVSWGRNKSKECMIPYSLPNENSVDMLTFNSTCR
ncbi:fimbria/pilus outer membrane usher protein [Serratia plymuthica]|uniref:fimbria/pilus outer membrane usher protein n=1 Tax=Serratia plymuthica TaxID=82996 RepID=UPI003DA23D33